MRYPLAPVRASVLLLTAIVACSGWGTPTLPQGSARLPVSTLHELSGVEPIRLMDRLERADFELPASNLPPDEPIRRELVLDGDWSKEERGDKGVDLWSTTLPVRTSKKKYGKVPKGLVLYRGAEELRFGSLPEHLREGRWDIEDGELLLASATDPEDWEEPPVLRFSREAELQERINYEVSGLDAVDFVRWDLTLGIETRPGLLIPAPGSASWTVTLPPGARLDLGAALVPRRLLTGIESDGAALDVRVDGVSVRRLELEPGGRFQDQVIDLSAHAGREIELSLATETKGSADYDHVFVSEPRLLGPPLERPRRIVVVGIDTLRFDAMTQHGYRRDTTAALDSFASSAVLFEDALNSAPRTRPSFRTAQTGRQPLPAMDAETLGEHLREAGFATAGITANVHLVPRMGFSEGYDSWQYKNGEDAEVQLERARRWLDSHRTEDSYLFVHLMDPHVFYRAPGLHKNRYVETDAGPLDEEMNRWDVLRLADRDELTEENKAWLRARYDGEVHYMAGELARFVAWLEELPGQTLVVLHSDHGEEFWEHGSYEHNHTLYQELVQGLFWVRPPGGWAGGPHRVEAPVGLVDLVPTLLDLVGRPRPELDGLSLRPFVDGGQRAAQEALAQTLRARPRPVGHLMYDRERWAVVVDDHKYVLQTWSGDQELYDLGTDPGERLDLAQQDRDLSRWHRALAEATGWPVGEGWRVRPRSRDTAFALRFPSPVQAQLLDPESDRTRRANLEWGDEPETPLSEVGTLVVSADGLSVAFQPGPEARDGCIAVLGEGPLTGELRVGDETLSLGPEGGRSRLGALSVQVTPGVVILPQDSVRQRLEARSGRVGGEDDGAIEALRALGYVE